MNNENRIAKAARDVAKRLDEPVPPLPGSDPSQTDATDREPRKSPPTSEPVNSELAGDHGLSDPDDGARDPVTRGRPDL